MSKLPPNVLCKLSEGEFHGAVHLVCSEETVADYSDETFAALQQKHPTPHWDSVIEPVDAEPEFNGEVSDIEVTYAVKSFPCWSAGGPDCMHPQHIKQMISGSAAVSGCFLLRAFVSFVNFVLSGAVKQSVFPPFFA